MARTAGSHGGVTGPRFRATALRLFARYGYAAVSMRQIAAEVGVQVGALYNYTPDKQSLLQDLMIKHLDEVLEAWNAEPRGQTPLDELEAFTRFHIRFHLERPDAVFIAYMELRNLEPAGLQEVLQRRKLYEQDLADILRRADEQGYVEAPQPKIASYALIAMLTGVNTWYRDKGQLSREEVADFYWNMVRSSVGAPEPQPEKLRAGQRGR